ncbi:RDD family protein [Nonomuraea turcica]|uniref:RDD family protein n=1 Tax=Nonomuraea sp. G32 TaxID=3067274 RepID=UPI00273B7077|nr:RDD family protein [Nonomuraea sp. G32]MDP4503648.1 RDD family protein [Nonomuraea sp. G32]
MAGTPSWAISLPAEWWERLAARLIEALVFGVFYYILFIALWAIFRTVGVLEVFGGRLPGVCAWFGAGLAYAGYDWRAHFRHGRTFGKAIMRIRLAPAKLTPGAALKRSLVYPGPLMLMGIPVVNLLAGMLLFGVGLLILIDKPLERGPHDRLAGTRVVKDLR